jgi:hypothetical protein
MTNCMDIVCVYDRVWGSHSGESGLLGISKGKVSPVLSQLDST